MSAQFQPKPELDCKSAYAATTIAARAGLETDSTHGAVMPALYLSTNYTFAGFKQKRQYDYTRSGNPTRDVTGQAIADLEGGFGSVLTASGMAALDLLFHYVQPGELIIAPHDCYGGTYRLLCHKAERGFFRVQFVDQGDPETFARILEADSPKLVLIETPSNPLLRLTDIQAICRISKQYGALCAVDNTFLSPVFQRPIALGADVVIHSTTKYLNGHSDVVGGAVVSATEELHQFFTWWGNCIGNTGAPFDSYLTLRGLRTLEIRLRQQEATALKLARYLEKHPAAQKVYYPGLESDSGHALACAQQSGFGAMISFELAGGEAEIRAFVENLELFSLAESLGGVESLIAHPATMTHAAMGVEARKIAGISDQLLRVSVGLEAFEDLVPDLERAFEHARAVSPQNAALSGLSLESELALAQ